MRKLNTSAKRFLPITPLGKQSYRFHEIASPSARKHLRGTFAVYPFGEAVLQFVNNL